MTSQALAGLLAGLLLVTAVAATLLLLELQRRRRAVATLEERRLEDLQRRGELERARDRAELSRDQARDALRASSSEALSLEARVLELERRDELVGELVIVNTPRPDDQSVRGVVRRELYDDEGRRYGLVLEAAVYLVPDHHQGRETVREVLAGDLTVPAYSFAQKVTRTHTDTAAEEG